MDVFLLILCLVIIGLLLLVNIYLVAYYSNVEDQGSGIAIFCKIVVVFTLIQCQGQELLLTVDASNSRGSGGGFNMALLWQIFYLSIFVNLGLILPFAIFLYESDFDKPLWKRVGITICEIFITVAAVCILTFVSWVFLSIVQLPIRVVRVSQFVDSSAAVSVTQSSQSLTMEFELGIPYYIMGLMCFFGYFVLVLCGGCGLSALPLDLLMQFRLRPKYIKTSQAKAKKQEFKEIVKQLLLRGQKLKNRMKSVEYSTGWWSKRKQKANVLQQFAEFQEDSAESEDRFQLYKMELDIQNTSLFTFIAKFILGIFCVFLTFLWWFQILFSELVYVDGVKLSGVVDDLLVWFEGQNANFIGVIWFMIMTQYLVFCILKGSFRFGVRIPFLFSFHPMKQGKTWMNSFLFNLSIVCLGCVAIVHLCSGCFQQYLRNTSISSIFIYQVTYLKFFQYFFKYKIFIYALIIWSPLISIYVIFKGVKKPDILQRIDQKRKKLKIKTENGKEYEMSQISKKRKEKAKQRSIKNQENTVSSTTPKSSYNKLPKTERSENQGHQKKIRPNFKNS